MNKKKPSKHNIVKNNNFLRSYFQDLHIHKICLSIICLILKKLNYYMMYI